MSLFDNLRKISSDGKIVSPLGETIKKIVVQNLMYTSCDDTCQHLFEEFNNYSLEMTISPKSSPRLATAGCCTCGATSVQSLTDQHALLMTLINELIERFKINILGVVELYKDGVNLHSHCVINNQKQNKIKNIKKYIKDFYRLEGPSVQLVPIRNREKYKQYLVKEPYGEYFYYAEYNEESMAHIEEIALEKVKKKNNKCKCQIIQCKSCKDVGV